MTTNEPSLNKKTFFATLWTVGSRMSIRFIGIISMVILAKILGPEDYGLIGKAIVIQGFLFLITELGIESALITNQKATSDHYNTGWTIHILRGLILGVILAVLAYPASIFMKEPRLELIIYCYAGITFLGGFYNIGVVDFRKNMTFEYDFYYSLYRKIVAFIITITVAYIWETYWALVAGAAAGMLTSLITSFWMSKFRPRISLSEWDSLFRFSKWVLLNEIVGAVSSQIDKFLLAYYSTNTNVGIYNVSYEISGMPSTELAMPVGRACAPSFAKLNDNIEEFSKLYVATISIVLAIVIPAATGVSMLSELIVYVALDDTWVDAIPVLQILAFYGLCRATMPTFISALLAYDRPDILTKSSILNVIYTVIILVVSINMYGFIGMVWGVLISGIVGVVVSQVIMSYINISPLWLLVKNLWRAVVANITMVIGLYYFQMHDIAFLKDFLLFDLIANAVLGAVIYTGTIIPLWYIFSKDSGPEKAILDTLLKRGNG